MAENSVAPVARGDTFFKGGTADTAGGLHLEGLVHVFPDTDPDDRVKRRSGGNVICVLVRNKHSAAVLPGEVVKWNAAGYGKETGAQNATLAGYVAGVVDDHLPTAGAAKDDLYWLIVHGVAKVKVTATVAADDLIYGSATAGDVNVKGSPTATDAANVLGHAIAAITTGNKGAVFIHPSGPAG